MTKEKASVNLREIAFQVLTEVLEEGGFSHLVLRTALERYQYLTKTERAFLTRLCDGTVERVITLDYILNSYSKTKVSKMKPAIRTILRMGVYQLTYMDHVPASAVCNEAVKLTQKRGLHGLKGFVNGVLRSIARRDAAVSFPDRSKEPVRWLAVAYSVPEWLAEKIRREYGDDTAEKIFSAALRERQTTVRVNTMLTTRDKLKEELAAEGIDAEPALYIPEAMVLKNYNYLSRLDSFRRGAFYVQDESSMLAVKAAGIQPGDLVVDVCGAPGGKALYAAELAGPSGRISVRDLTEDKTELIEENVRRLTFTNVEVKTWDAREKDTAYEGKANVVLADLPCSGLGVMGRKADIKYHVTQESILELAALQREILAAAADYVKPGGILIYSTCTVTEEENGRNRDWFLNHYPFEADSLDAYLPETLQGETTGQGFLQLLPGVHGTDGFYIARFRRR
ncbi:16S rRNA (cytosine(967)-C(5))-methyltransferase RsmB [Anaerolentibacter hominis]|uniref:16S rRNA (cytosine(967)-C(5))-methyltransferase RsmB n=1 Tax=Anaerolentibacter hominis TaxID=3079009 RepID=UPI0031B8439E